MLQYTDVLTAPRYSYSQLNPLFKNALSFLSALEILPIFQDPAQTAPKKEVSYSPQHLIHILSTSLQSGPCPLWDVCLTSSARL